MIHHPTTDPTPQTPEASAIDRVTVIVRGAGERTAETSRRLLLEQVPEGQVFAIAERPFTRAVQRTFEIGAEQGRPWTLAIDADVLVRSGAVADLVALGEASPPEVFEVQGLVLDKLFGTARGAGNHLFRTSLVQEAMQHIPPEGRSRRPETWMLNRMRERGHGWSQGQVMVGLHDFEQYYRDVYRKSFVHARKHQSRSSFFERYWAEMAQTDPDFDVALWGLRAGATYAGPLLLDVNRFPSDIGPLLHMRGWEEKSPLPTDAYSAVEVDALLSAATANPSFQRWRHLLKLADAFARAPSWRGRANAAVRTLGWRKGAPWIAGRGFERLGQRLSNWAER